MTGPCRECPGHKEPPLDPPEERDGLTDEEIRQIKADEKDDDRRGK